MPVYHVFRRFPPHAAVALSAWVSKVTSAFCQLASVRILIEILGVDLYAAFSLLIGISGWFMLIDLGIGPSLQNFVSECRVSNRGYAGILTAGSLSVIGALFVATAALFFCAPALASFLLASAPLSDADKAHSFFLAGLAFLGAGAGSLAYRLWFGEDRGYLSNIAPAVASLAGLIGLWTMARIAVHPSLPLCLTVWAGPTAIIPLAVVVARLGRDIRISGLPDRSDYRAVLARSMRFSLLAFMAALTLQVDYIVMSRVVSLDQIAQYNVLSKAYNLVFFLYGSVLSSLWPTLTRLSAKGDRGQIKQHLAITMAFGAATIAVGTIVLAAFPQAVSGVLAGGRIPILASAGCAMGFYYLIRVWTDAFSTLIMSVSRVSAMLWLSPVQAGISIIAQIYLGSRYGIYGIVVGLSLSFLLTAAWILPLQAVRLGLLK